jgi:hypothetical protein
MTTLSKRKIDMLNFISTNPVTDTIRQNQNQALQQAVEFTNLQQAIGTEKAGRAIGQIYAGPDTITSPATTTTQSVPQAGPPAPTYNPTQMSESGGPTSVTPLPNVQQTVTTPGVTKQVDKLGMAMQAAAATPGAGGLSLKLAEQQQSRNIALAQLHEQQLANAHEYMINDPQYAYQYAQSHGLDELMPLFSDKNSLMQARSTGAFGKSMGLTGYENLQFSGKVAQLTDKYNKQQGMDPVQAHSQATLDALSQMQNMPGKPLGQMIDENGVVRTRDEGGNVTVLPGQENGGFGKSSAALYRAMRGGNGPKVHSTYTSNGQVNILMSDGTTKSLGSSNDESKVAARLWELKSLRPGYSIAQAKDEAHKLSGGNGVVITSPDSAPSQPNYTFIPGQGVTEITGQE